MSDPLPPSHEDEDRLEEQPLMQEGASQTDVTASPKAEPSSSRPQMPELSGTTVQLSQSRMAQQPECKAAHEAVKEISGKEAKMTVEALSKAYNHSKICGDCNERLGNLVGDVVKQLGVRMPRIREVGPGSVGWDPKATEGGYKVKPSVSSLMMSTEELKDKCRLKDAIIEILADELRDLERKGRWNAHGVMRELNGHQNPSPIDFNRQTLCRYLNNQLLDGFDDRDEKGREYFASNPLGFTVVRRVGPDSLLVKWLPLTDPKITCYEIFMNGLLMQRVLSPGRNKSLLHPIDLDRKLILTLNALSYDGEKIESAYLTYSKR